MTAEMILPLAAIWLGCGALGVFLMIVADKRAEQMYGVPPMVTRPDWIMWGVVTLALGVWSYWLTRRKSG
jgi:hypothetical protein